MKRLLSAFLLCALLLSLAGCGAKKDALTAPPELTVTNAQDASVAVSSGSYDWNYALGNGERSGAIACGAHPLDENCRDITPVLEMPIAVSASHFYVVTLDFGGCSPIPFRCGTGATRAGVTPRRRLRRFRRSGRTTGRTPSS